MKTEGAILPGEKPVDPVEVLLDLIRENHALKEQIRTDRFPLSALWDAFVAGIEKARDAQDYWGRELHDSFRPQFKRAADAYVKLVVSQREES